MRFHLCTLTSSATALSLLLLTNSSSADRKSYHGAGCIFSRAHSILDYVPQYSYRGAFNDGTADQEVYCPVLRDLTEGAATLDQVSIEFISPDRPSPTHTGWYTHCTVATMGQDGDRSQIDYIHQQSYAEGFYQFNFYDLETANGNEGAYYVSCRLNQGDQLLHVYVDEQ